MEHARILYAIILAMIELAPEAFRKAMDETSYILAEGSVLGCINS